MLMYARVIAVALLVADVTAAVAEAPLPVVEEISFAPLKANCERLLKALDALNASLPAETQKALAEILRTGSQNPKAAERIQNLLDPRCLIGVTINPESRVKAARGHAKAELVQGSRTAFLAKVHNQAGVTQALKVSSPHIGAQGDNGEGRWLDADVYAKQPMPERLSGYEVEYVILVLVSREAGKREARLTFDVGQGTQDLGFRAEVPILFSIKAKQGAR